MGVTINQLHQLITKAKEGSISMELFFRKVWKLNYIPKEYEFQHTYLQIYKMVEANKDHDLESFAKANVMVGINYLDTGQYLPASIFLTKGLATFRSIHDQAGEAFALIQQATLHRIIGNNEQALSQLTQSIEVLETSNKYISFLNRAYAELGKIYLEERAYLKSLHYYNKCLALGESRGNLTDTINAHVGIAYNYLAYSQPLKAYQHIKLGMKDLELAQPAIYARFSNCLGQYYLQMDNHKNAITHFNFSKKHAQKYKQHHEKIHAIIGLAESQLLSNRNVLEAKTLLENALTWATNHQLSVRTYPIHRLLAELALQMKKPKLALIHFELYEAYRSQVFSSQNKKKCLNTSSISTIAESKRHVQQMYQETLLES